MRKDRKRPDGITIFPWSRGRPLAWDVTVPDTYADAHVMNTASEAGAVANHGATNKNTKYSQLAPSGGGTGTGDWKTRRTSNITRRCQGVHLPVPAAVRGTTEGNAVSFQNTFTAN